MSTDGDSPAPLDPDELADYRRWIGQRSATAGGQLQFLRLLATIDSLARSCLILSRPLEGEPDDSFDPGEPNTEFQLLHEKASKEAHDIAQRQSRVSKEPL